VDGGTNTINNSTFSGNSANEGGGIDDEGGGIDDEGGTLTINDSTFSGNFTFTPAVSGGGGICFFGDTLRVNGSTFYSNSVSSDYMAGGGGIYLYGGTLTLTNCTLSGNFVANSGVVGPGGGGICLDGASTATITGSMFSGNTASADTGGGISGWQGALTIIGSTFSGNSAGGSYSYGGGGIYLYRDTLTLNNSTFSGNQAIAGGGGIWVQNGPYYAELLINNSTFSGNSGGGILFGGNVFYLTNTIVAGNTPGDISGGSFGANNLTNGNPLLAPLGNYGGPTQTMPPLPGSPAIGAGSVAANIFATDQRGYPRTQNGLIDIGAVELQSSAANPPVLENITVPAGGGANGLQFTFTNAPAADFTVLTATNVSLALTNWTVLGEVQQVAPGRYQFTDPQAATNRARFYRVRSP
ncbi:MAG TPA: choice-of-anchor Q domain-containing protein, partial [Verrucomicrobiae bacterium]|nr:choice-of-anchor Q domain-containing protein [Verrucomicrobiae bacterium]